MLVLTRLAGESVEIFGPDQKKIGTVTRIDYQKIGFDFLSEYKIHRCSEPHHKNTSQGTRKVRNGKNT